MTTPDAARLRALERTASKEADAAAVLKRYLHEARLAVECLDPQGLDAALAGAGSAAAALAREAGQRSRLTSELARVVGLPPDAPLTRVVETLGAEQAELGRAANELGRGLEALACQSTALGICTRYGAAVSRHLSSLGASRVSYGPEGRLASRTQTAERRV
jgi:hypothetical protein